MPKPIERHDAALALDKSLTPAARALFEKRVLVGQLQGAQPADWLDMADNYDAHLDLWEPWMERHAEDATRRLMQITGLGEDDAKRLLGLALYVHIATEPPVAWPKSPSAQDVADTAERAAMWLAGLRYYETTHVLAFEVKPRGETRE